MKEQWMQDIKRKLENHEQPAPEMNWDAIFRATQAERQARRRTTIVGWRKMLAAAALIGVLAGSVVLLSRYNSDAPSVAKATEESAQQGFEDRAQMGSENVQSNYENKQAIYKNKQAIYENILTVCKNILTVDETPASAAENLVATLSAPASTEAAPTEVAVLRSTDETPTCEVHEQKAAKGGFASSPSRKSPSLGNRHMAFASGTPFTAKAYVSGAFGATANSSGFSALASASPYIPNDAETNVGDNYPLVDQASSASRTVKHHLPLRFGLSLRYQLSPRWSVEGGVSYSRHSSDITETIGSHSLFTDQTLTFIGIPVNANYSVWSNRHVNVYLSAGGEVERLVNGKRTTRPEGTSQNAATTEEKVKSARPLFSVNAAVGVEAKIGSTVSVFAEPGVGYHFDNGSALETIYSEKPLNLNLNLGLRFTLK